MYDLTVYWKYLFRRFEPEPQVDLEAGDVGGSFFPETDCRHQLCNLCSQSLRLNLGCKGSLFRIMRKPEVALQVYTIVGDAASGSWSSCVDSSNYISLFP